MLTKDIIMTKNDGYEELVGFIRQNEWQVFGTFTFKFNVEKEQAERALNIFWNIVDRKLFGNLSYRKNVRSKRLCFLQSGKSNNNHHIHFVANSVDGLAIEDFGLILKYIWQSKIVNAGKEIRIEKIRSLDATSRYLAHEFYKLGNDTLALTCSNI